MKYLSESLKSNNSIQTLNLRFNNIGSEGMKYLSESLESNNSIQNLNLESNETKDIIKYNSILSISHFSNLFFE